MLNSYEHILAAVHLKYFQHQDPIQHLLCDRVHKLIMTLGYNVFNSQLETIGKASTAVASALNIGVGAQSILGGTTFLPEKYV